MQNSAQDFEGAMKYFFDNSPDMMCIANEQGYFEKVNKAFTKTLGWSEEELTSKPYVTFIHEEDKNKTGVVAKDLNEGTPVIDFENRYVTKDGGYRWIGWTSSPPIDGKIYAIAHDITRYKELETDLKKFKMAVEKASDHIVISDSEGILLFANEAVAKVTGYAPSEIIGTKAGKLWGGLMEKSYYEKLWDTVKNKKQTFKGEIKNRRKNGEIYTSEVTITPITNYVGDVKYFIGIERDISQMKKAQNMRDDLISFASHELKTPLAKVKWGIEILLEEKVNLANEQLDLLEDIHRSNNDTIEFINNFLDASKIEDMSSESLKVQVKVHEVLAQAVKSLQERANKKDIKITSNISETLPLVAADPILLKNVYSNIISNGIKYTPKGGNITIRARHESDLVIVSITDNGMGITSEEEDKVFNKLYRSDRAKKLGASGSGFGLYFVKIATELFGGKVWFDSEVDKGTTFWVSLPVGSKKE